MIPPNSDETYPRASTAKSGALKPGDRFNPSRQSCGFYAPDVVARLRDLTDGQKRLYERAVRWAGKKDIFWYSFETMANQLGKSVRQVKNDMAVLQARRFIAHSRRRRSSNIYHFLWHAIFEVQPTAHQDDDLKVQDMHHGVQDKVKKVVPKVQPTAQELCTSSNYKRESSSAAECTANDEPATVNDDDGSCNEKNEELPLSYVEALFTCGAEDGKDREFDARESASEMEGAIDTGALNTDDDGTCFEKHEEQTAAPPEAVFTPQAEDGNDRNFLALVDMAREQLRLARADGRGGFAPRPDVKAPDRTVTIQILEAFRTADDFTMWLKSTVRRRLAQKALDCRWGLYLKDAQNLAEDIAAQRLRDEQRQRDWDAERQRQEAQDAAATAGLDHPMPALEAYGRIQVRLQGHGVPGPLKARLKRTGELISPNELARQILGWQRCQSCQDEGATGYAIDRNLKFCRCAAGVEARYRDGCDYPEREMSRVHADAKSLLVAAGYACGLQSTAYCIDHAEVVDDGVTVEFRGSTKLRLVSEDEIRELLERVGWNRQVLVRRPPENKIA